MTIHPRSCKRSRFLLSSAIRLSPDTPPRIASYINNVHPVRTREIYELLQTLLQYLLPLIDKTLSILVTPFRFWAPRVDVERNGDDDLPSEKPEAYQPQWKRTRSAYLRSHKDPYERPLTLHTDFRDTGYQMTLDISRISDPRITDSVQHRMSRPKPNSRSPPTHLPLPNSCKKISQSESMHNERICTTFLYCYSYSKIHEYSVSSRHRISNDEPIDLNSVSQTTAATEKIYEIKDHAPCMHDLDNIKIRENRVNDFPNVNF